MMCIDAPIKETLRRQLYQKSILASPPPFGRHFVRTHPQNVRGRLGPHKDTVWQRQCLLDTVKWTVSSVNNVLAPV